MVQALSQTTAFQGAEVVFHVAAPDSSISNYKLHYSVNVQGTKNIIDACVECKVKRLVYTSSPSVVFDGAFDGIHELHYVDESTPYPEKFNNSYSATKAEGEKLVFKANGQGGLLTCCIRPSGIFGQGDRLLVPSLVAAARAGKSNFVIGDGNNLYDFTYIENVAHGHICAEKALASGANVTKVAGQAYFITNMEPIKFWEFVSRILEGLGYERPRTKIPVLVIMPLAHAVDWTYKIFACYGMCVPQLTPSRIRLLSCTRTFSCSKPTDLLGYEPIISLEEGLKRTIDSYPDLQAKQWTRTKSKASLYLGNERAKLLSVIALLLFIHSTLPTKALDFKIEKIPSIYFHLSEDKSRQVATSICFRWNSLVSVLKSICKGKDWPLFLKVASALLFLNFIGAMSLQKAFEIGLPFIFVAFSIYEKWEAQIDALLHDSFFFISRLKSDATKKITRHQQSILGGQFPTSVPYARIL